MHLEHVACKLYVPHFHHNILVTVAMYTHTQTLTRIVVSDACLYVFCSQCKETSNAAYIHATVQLHTRNMFQDELGRVIASASAL
jgi:hypothetical protein